MLFLLLELFRVSFWFVSRSISTFSIGLIWIWKRIYRIFLWRIQFDTITWTRWRLSSITLMFRSLLIWSTYFFILLRNFLTNIFFCVFDLRLILFLLNLIFIHSLPVCTLCSFSDLSSHFIQLLLLFFDIYYIQTSIIIIYEIFLLFWALSWLKFMLFINYFLSLGY